MEKLIKKITNIALLALSAIALVAGLYVGVKGAEASAAMNLSFYLTYALLFIGIIMIIAFAVMQMASNKKQLISTLIMLVAAVAIFFVCYIIAPSELSDVAKRVGVTESVYKWIGGALLFAYITFIGVIVTFLGTYVYIKIKNR